ncbi:MULTISPECIES: DUF5951 family protein [Enterobacteriaceae]|uniref:DUF5951 family protein n=1 Tax=Enterobacteriaceae TaxID=543 RepID=UPI001C6272B5
MESYLSGEKTFVKPQFTLCGAVAYSINNLSPLQTKIKEKCFAGTRFLPHHLKWSFNFQN